METGSGRRHAMSSRTPTSRAEEALPHQTSPPAAAAPQDPAQVPAVATPKPKLVIKLTIDRNKPEYISQNDAITVAELKRQSAQEEVKSGTEEKHRANRALPLPQPKRFQGALSPLAPNTVCVSTLLKEEDLARMPSLDGATLTRAQRRASTSLHARPKVVTNGVNGVHANTSGSSASQVNAATTNGEVELKKKPSSSNSSKKLEDKEREKALERNIDNVIFGDVTFKAWYPSWYPKEIIGEKALNGDGKGIVVGELYVCKRCFGYGKVVTEWVRHTRVCEREVPGRKIYDHGKDGAWSVWEVDGGVETIFCQNLSLFAKLFLDNKSVFFDVSGFNYFLLVHTSSTTGSQQIVGFFSKEKMSWDNNNLACILIFPPWQRKSLGSLLMGVSYAISRREGILGGPEKPISDLGKKGYKRYWGAEIARWLLECKETDRKKGKGMANVEIVSRETWIAPEDCLSVLREMGVMEKAGKGRGEVERVRVDKVKVREWVEREKLSLDRAVDEDGFVGGYAIKETEEEVEDEEMGE